MQISDLVPDTEYRFEHERLGSIRALFIDWETDSEAPMLRVNIFTGNGTERPDLARAMLNVNGVSMRPEWTERQFRAELITEIHEMDEAE